jgi:hypothetical protein
MSSWIRVGLVGLFAAWLVLVGWLLAVDLRSWHRTAPLRLGRLPTRPAPVCTTSSPTTRIAWLAGASVGACGLLLILTSRPTGAPVALVGTAIAVSGIRSRVTGLAVRRDGLVVRYAARAPFAIAWTDCVALRPPRWPLAGWGLVGCGAHRTLMPSDVLGQEAGLESIVGFADFVFDGRDWVRRP